MAASNNIADKPRNSTQGLDPDLGPGLDYQKPLLLLLPGPEQGSETKGLGHKQQQQQQLLPHLDLADLDQDPSQATAVALATALHQLEIKIYLTGTTLETGLAAMILHHLKVVCLAGLRS